MEYTQLQTPQTYARGLEKVGYWECECCSFTRTQYEKVPIVLETGDRLLRSIKCFCCGDHGTIPDLLIRKYIMPEYQSFDPPIACLRCNSAERPDLMWQIATPEDCELIDRAERAAFFKAEGQPDPQQVKQVVQEYITGLEMPKSDDPQTEYPDYPEYPEHYAV
jgi:hypothetical protein